MEKYYIHKSLSHPLRWVTWDELVAKPLSQLPEAEKNKSCKGGTWKMRSRAVERRKTEKQYIYRFVLIENFIISYGLHLKFLVDISYLTILGSALKKKGLQPQSELCPWGVGGSRAQKLKRHSGTRLWHACLLCHCRVGVAAVSDTGAAILPPCPCFIGSTTLLSFN